MYRLKRILRRVLLGKHCYRLLDLNSLYYGILLFCELDCSNSPKETVEMAYKHLSIKEKQKAITPILSKYDNYAPYSKYDFKLSKEQICKILVNEIQSKGIYKKDMEKYSSVVKGIYEFKKNIFKV